MTIGSTHPDAELAGRDGHEHGGTDRPTPRGAPPPPAGGAVYGLGMIGAAIWYWKRADDTAGRAIGLLKAAVWPAFLVHDAFEALDRLPPT
jgi:hypothetical protein